MIRYVKCPRCELNYIDADKQEYCDVCIAEMKGNKLEFADLDEDELVEEFEEETSELCSICGVNHVRYGENICDSCKKLSEYDGEEEIDPEQDEEWKNYLSDDTEDLTLDDAKLDEELKEELEEEEEDDEFFDNEEELEDEDVDSLDDLEDFDDDEDDEEDDDDDLF